MVRFSKALIGSGLSALAVGGVHWFGHWMNYSTNTVGLLVVASVFAIGFVGMLR